MQQETECQNSDQPGKHKLEKDSTNTVNREAFSEVWRFSFTMQPVAWNKQLTCDFSSEIVDKEHHYGRLFRTLCSAPPRTRVPGRTQGTGEDTLVLVGQGDREIARGAKAAWPVRGPLASRAVIASSRRCRFASCKGLSSCQAFRMWLWSFAQSQPGREGCPWIPVRAPLRAMRREPTCPRSPRPFEESIQQQQ